MTAAIRLTGLATAAPATVLAQEEVAAAARGIFTPAGAPFERLAPVYANAGIRTRRSAVPLAWYRKTGGWRERNALYLEKALALLEQAARRCLEDGGARAEEIDALVVVSTTGIATPSLDARLMDVLPFRRDVARLPIFGLGCAGGVLGLARAAALARVSPGARVLFLVVELCGLTFRSADCSNSNVVATALFGDGAAAALLHSDGPPEMPAIAAWGEYTWPNSLDVMGWKVEDDGLGVLFSREIPDLIRRRFGAALDGFLADRNLERSDIARYLCHPGGAKVLDVLEDTLHLPRGGLVEGRDVLRDYGNMSAATLLFVLERARRRSLAGRSLLTALGPGFTAGFLLLEASVA
ncbi:MAG: type III polyketide synthase [Kiloniellales bacterium]